MALLFAILATSIHGAESANVFRRLDNRVGVTPAMGFNNWNSGLPSSASTATNTATQFVSLGLKDLGYQYINMDDMWMASSRDANGNLQPNPTNWPQGIANVTSQIHTLGLKFGLYGDSGTTTCSGFPGSQGYEAQDAKQLASWGVDYWKYDNCATPSGNSEPRYTLMGQQLLAAAPSSRPILYSLCNWGADSVYTWGATVGNSWRVGGDITNSWSSIASIAAANAAIASYAQPGGFNDFDMMEIGNGGLTTAEERAHFGLWAISKSPLLLGTDLSKINASSLEIIKNKAVIAINQDSLGKAAALFQPSGTPAPVPNQLYPYWAGPLSDGVVIGLVAANGAATLSVNFVDVPGLGAGTYSWTELWSNKTGSGTSISATLASHDMAIYKVKTSGSPNTSKSASMTHISTSSSTRPITTISTTTSSVTSAPSTSSSASSGPGVAQWGQCGGIGYSGSTTCQSPYICHVLNNYYSQCY